MMEHVEDITKSFMQTLWKDVILGCETDFTDIGQVLEYWALDNEERGGGRKVTMVLQDPLTIHKYLALD